MLALALLVILWEQRSGSMLLASATPPQTTLAAPTVTVELAGAQATPASIPGAQPSSASPQASGQPPVSSASPASLSAIPSPQSIAGGTPGAAVAASGTPEPPNASSSDSGPFHTYEVQLGDSVRTIAAASGVSITDIAESNGLVDPSYLQVGQQLVIPDQPGILYRLKAGESVGDVAARSGVSASAILSASALAATAAPDTGSLILIPDTVPTPGE